MAAGDFLVRRNNADNSTLGNTGAVFDATWDTEVISEGSAATYSAGTFTFTNTAPYLVMYSDQWNTTNTTNNERIGARGRLRINGANITEAAGEGYIRKSSGQQSMVINGVAIYNATAGDTMTTRFFRHDNSTSGTVDRVAGVGGVHIIELSAADDYARYTTTANQNMTSTEANVTNWSTDEEETGFSRSGDTVTISTAGRYLMTFSAETSQSGSSRLGAVVFAENGTTPITGIRGYSHMRGSDSTNVGGMSFAGIIDVAANDTITLRKDADSGTMIMDSGAKWQFWKLPAGNNVAVKEATNGNMNLSDAEFSFDTNPITDSAFSVTDAANIATTQSDHVLMFTNLGKTAIDSVQRAYPRLRPMLDGTPVNYAAGGQYHRNSGNIGTFMVANVNGLLPLLPSGTDIGIFTDQLGANGTLDVESGHLSLLSLEGLYKNYSYAFPPVVTSVGPSNAFLWGATGLVIAGNTFGAVQGTGKVEFWSDPSGTTKVQQTVTNWSETSITIDTVQGALSSDTVVYLVVTADSGGANQPFSVDEGLKSYPTVIADTNPDHLWTLNNTYDDTGNFSTTSNLTTVIGNGGTMQADPISEQTTHSWNVSGSGNRRECPNSNAINTTTIQERLFGGWFRPNTIYPGLTCIYEEGGGVNNVAFYIGIGNRLIASYADTGDDNAQAFSDFALEPGRAYHILWGFTHSQVTNEFRLWIDGVKQTVTAGNPLTSGDLDSHSGDISFGGPGGNLEVAGTDVLFNTVNDGNYSNWASWRSWPSDLQILNLFRRGAIPDVTISSDTEVNMQAALDALADTVRDNAGICIRVEEVAGLGTLNLSADNITFPETASIWVEYRGADPLNWTNLNGSNLRSDKVFSSVGGTVNIINPAVLTLTNLQPNTEVRVFEAGTATELGGVENSTTSFSLSVQVPAVDIAIISLGYQNLKLEGIVTTADTSLPIQQQLDRNYVNP